MPADANIVEYFQHLGGLGGKIEASDRAGDTIALDDAVVRAVSLSLATKQTGSRVLFVGNGGSAAIASHMATDWLKNGGYAATCFNDASTLTCLGNDLGYDQVFALQIERHGRVGDLLFAISSSGKSRNILNAVTAANKVGTKVITLTGFSPDNPLRRMGNLNFWLPDYHYGFAEIGHLAICHAILDMSMGWRRVGDLPVATAPAVAG